jgi:hypothetical protein
MPATPTIRVFISSPADVRPERQGNRMNHFLPPRMFD